MKRTKTTSLGGKLGMTLVLAGAMGVAMGLPIYASADEGDGNTDDITLTPRDGDGQDGSQDGKGTINNLNDAQRDGFLPYDNNGNDDNGGFSDANGNDDSDDLDGVDDYEVNTPLIRDDSQNGDTNGDGVTDGDDSQNGGDDLYEGGDGDDLNGVDDYEVNTPLIRDGSQVGDTVYDDEGNAWIIVARPEDGSADGVTIGNLADAIRYGFQVVAADGNENNPTDPTTDPDGSGSSDGQENQDDGEPALQETRASIIFRGDEGNEDKRPQSIIIRVFDGDSGVELYTYSGELSVGTGNVGFVNIKVPVDEQGYSLPFMASVDAVDYYDSTVFRLTEPGKYNLMFALTYTGEKLVDPSIEFDEKQDDETPVVETEEPKEETAVETPKEEPTPKKETPVEEKKTVSSKKDLPQMGDQSSVTRPLALLIASLASVVGAFITKRMGA